MEGSLKEAVCTGDLQRVQELIRNGADMNASCGEGSLLILSILGEHRKIALALLSDEVDIHTKNRYGKTAFHHLLQRLAGRD